MSPIGEDGRAIEPGEYCRQVESYLCRKNDGHLVRIVGPSFDRVTGWAARGVPVKVAFQGIDRAFERYHAAGRRRRPLHIDFCEADVLDCYDAWRRAVGASVADAARPDADNEPPRTERRPSLPAHLSRVLVRLSSFLATQDAGPDLGTVVERITQEVARMREDARGLRGDARSEAVARLSALDRELTDAVLQRAPEAVAAEARAAATAELAPLRDRMSTSAYDAASQRLCAREIRSRLQLPTLTLD